MADLDRLLERTSRTFALAIPLLPEPTRREVSVAYLLFRLADTFEDAASWPRTARLEALTAFEALLASPSPEEARRLSALWLAARPTEHAGYLELLAETPAVLDELLALSPAARGTVVKHARRTSEGMRSVVAASDEGGRLRLTNVPDLKRYCYIVAGIVGELLTDLFLLGTPSLAAVEAGLRAHDVAFGEGLQLVNILKDARDDARDGRSYLPEDVPRSELFGLARRDLGDARSYVAALSAGGAPRGVLAFTSLPVLLAQAALEKLEGAGPGAKVGRDELFGIIGRMHEDLDRGITALASIQA
jgi:farnesyl-diphosphate farnesyltransferase